MASEAEVIIGRMSDEPYWTVDVTDKAQLKRWTRLTQQAGGEILEQSSHWTRFHIPADKLRFGVKHTRTLTEEQRDILRQRMQQTRARQR